MMTRNVRAGETGELHVLVVDDSAVARQVISALLGAAGGIRVSTAADGLLALDRLRRERPHVVVLDLEMPRLDGLAFLRRAMEEQPVPVVVCSATTGRGTDAALRALAAGAVEVLDKSALNLRDGAGAAGETLLAAVRAAAASRVGRRASSPPSPTPSAPPPTLSPTDPRQAPQVVVIGASTGGTEALRRVLAELPADAPPIAIVQHMPAGFTGALARSLDADCRVRVAEARGGEILETGTVLLAPGGRHLSLRRVDGRLAAQVSDGAPVSRHRPSVDVLFRSAAAAAGPRAVGVLLTGMGDDGADGLGEMRLAGARTIAQDEASSVVWGMPREAVLRGAAGEVLSLQRIGAALRALRAAEAA
jgi:two-component system chemotaxis response regulator CheB